MRYVLDTIVSIWAVRGRPNADVVLARLHAEGDCAVTRSRCWTERHGRALAAYSPFQYPLARCELVALTTVLEDQAEA